MPPVRKPRPARPQTSRCRYVPTRGQRCTRLATIAGDLCRQHAEELGRQLGAIPGRPMDPPRGLMDVLQGVIAHGQGAFASVLEDAIQRGIDGLMAGVAARGVPLPRSGSAPRSAPRPPPGPTSRPPPPPPRQRDELARARAVMGFDPGEILTQGDVQERRRELARIFHPDRQRDPARQKTATERMTRINEAADLLERALAKSA